MDGFTGFKTAAAADLPDAVPVMDPFHVVRLAGDALDRCRQRIQHATMGHRGRSGDLLYSARRTELTLLTEKQRGRLTLGRTMKKRAADVLAYFDRAGTSNCPTDAINDRSDQRPTRAPPRLRPRLPQPRELYRPKPARNRRLQTSTAPSTAISQASITSDYYDGSNLINSKLVWIGAYRKSGSKPFDKFFGLATVQLNRLTAFRLGAPFV